MWPPPSVDPRSIQPWLRLKKKNSKRPNFRHLIVLFRLSSAFQAPDKPQNMGIFAWNGTYVPKEAATPRSGAKQSHKNGKKTTKLFHANTHDRTLVGGCNYTMDAMVTLVAMAKNSQEARMMLGPSRSSPRAFVHSYLDKLVSKIKVLRAKNPVRLIFVFDGDRCVHFAHSTCVGLFRPPPNTHILA